MPRGYLIKDTKNDLRALYIVWLAAQDMLGSYDEEEDYEIDVPPVPPAFDKLTAAQQTLAELLRVPRERLDAAAQHSRQATRSSNEGDFAAWVRALPPERRDDYLVRLARNEPGLSRQLVRELRERNRDKTHTELPTGERVTYATLRAESKALKARREREERERKQAEHERHLRDIYEHRDDYWRQVELAAARGSGAGYDEAVRLLSEIREAAGQFQASSEFQERFHTWVWPLLHRPSLIRRLREHQFSLPER